MRTTPLARLAAWLLLPPLLFSSALAHADRVLVAVASNFAAPMGALAERFEAETGHEIAIATGASGRFYAQIRAGAPFQLFFSADRTKPQALVDSGLAIADSSFTYAVGRLVLWSADPALDLREGQILAGNDYKRLALANPRLAPYGEAARQVLDALGLRESSEERWVMGENIAQTFQFVSTGNAELGFVALSQLGGAGSDPDATRQGSGWLVPESLHEPIRQDAVLLSRAADCSACRDFLDFVASDSAQDVLADFGYARDRGRRP